MRKSRSRKYNKMGGDASISMPSTSNTGSSGGLMGWMSNALNSTKKNSQGLFSKLSESTSNMMNKAKSGLDTSKPSPVSYTPSPSSTTPTSSYTPTPMQGGRKKRGGKSIAYDAAPVYHSNVAKPTYWIGGKSRRKRSKSRSTRRLRRHRR